MSKARTSLGLGLIVGLLGASAPAHAREIRRLAPSSKWVVDYAEDSCRLARSFGTGDQRVDLVFDRFAPSEWFRVTMAGAVFTARNIRVPVQPRFRFGPNEDESQVNAFGGMLGPTPAIISSGSIRLAPYTDAERAEFMKAAKSNQEIEPRKIDPVRERAAIWLEVNRVVKDVDLVLETGRMDQALEALRQCTWDTVRSWGMDVEQQKKLSRHAAPKQRLNSIFSSKDYPKKMARDGQQGIVNVRLIIDEKGSVESCVIQKSTRPKEFDEVTCAIFKQRARFDPALDEGGKPIRSYFNQIVIFRIA